MNKERFQEFLTAMNSSDMPITPCSLCHAPRKDDTSPTVIRWIRSLNAVGVALLFAVSGLAGALLYLLTQ